MAFLMNRIPACAVMMAALLLAWSMTGCRKSEVLYLGNETAVENDANRSVGEDDAGERPEAQGIFETETAAARVAESIAVFVCGAVNRPGVYTLPPFSRANDAVEAAGGFRPDADTQWCNLAQQVLDGQKLRIYTLEETTLLQSEGMREEGLPDEGGTLSETGLQPTDAEGEQDGRINLNSATREELMTLPGIGQARAEAILAWREMHGSFTDPGQIKEISGFKDAIYNSIRDFIYAGPTEDMKR